MSFPYGLSRVTENGFVSFDVPYNFNNNTEPSYQYV